MSDGGSSNGGPIVCSPGARRCDGHDIKQCDDTGSDEFVDQDCLSAECRMQGSQPVCAPTACAANLAVCDGNIATQCKLDGSGPKPGGVDCSESKQFCRAGECRDTLCEPDQKSCKDGDVYLCSTDGSSLSVWDWCTDSELCDEDSHTCVAHVCEADELSCDGTRVVTCNSVGSAWLPATTDCAAQGKFCVAGRCEKRSCAPSTTFCKGNERYQCDPTGASSTLLETCRSGVAHCEVTPAGLYAFCVANVCVAGTKVCDRDMVKTCNADGSLPADGTYCSKDEFCEDAECKPRGCELGTLFCKDEDVYSCQDTGPQLHWQCDPGQACLAIIAPDQSIDPNFYADLVTCAQRPCPPGRTGCALNRIGTCAADGESLSAVTNDCAASGKLCTADATCAASVSEPLGQAENVVSLVADMFVGNLVEVHSPRKLTELQMWLVFAAPRDLHWTVYELVGNDLLPRVEKTTNAASSAGFVGSGPLSFSYQLETGKRYVLGVQISGDTIGMLGSIIGAPSFGPLLCGINSYGLSPFSIVSSVLPNASMSMKVTTESP